MEEENGMKYYFNVSESTSIINISDLKDYIVKSSLDGKVARICFTENQYKDILRIFNYEKLSEMFSDDDLWFNCIGEDNFLYRLKRDGLTKFKKMPFYTLKRWYYQSVKNERKLSKDKNHRDKYLSKTNCTTICSNNKLPRVFNKFQYIDKENTFVIPFRFKKAKNENAPLLVFHAGAGALGHRNFFPMCEFLPIYFKIRKYKCNILIPQAPKGTNYLMNWIDYSDYTVGLIKRLFEKYPIDENRVYIMGTSQGGFCTWTSIANHSEIFAAALPVMGGFTAAQIKDDSVFENIKKVPMWIAHSSDDVCVSVNNDDYCYEKLKSIGANVKYTRWEKYGHKMAGKFYRKESWEKWMFEQSK